MELENNLSTTSADQLAKAVKTLLAPHFNPVFGASKLIEHEVAALEVLKQLGLINSQADEYELVQKLRITKSKARTLMYQSALRSGKSQGDWESEIRKILTNPTVYLNGEMVFIEVYNPLLMDILRSNIRDLGFISNGTFSDSLARIPLNALAALIKTYIPEDRRSEVESNLNKQGIEGITLEGLIIGFLKKFGQSLADETGGKLGQKIGEGVSELLSLTKAHFRK